LGFALDKTELLLLQFAHPFFEAGDDRWHRTLDNAVEDSVDLLVDRADLVR
jgi:hypothetical protein